MDSVDVLAQRCVCGHDKVLHEHYRAGDDCGVCACHRYRRVGSTDWLSVAVWGTIIFGSLAFWAGVIWWLVSR